MERLPDLLVSKPQRARLTMARHYLKTWPDPYEEMRRGNKGFEYRKDDREPRFEVGDTLLLERWDPADGFYRGGYLERLVTYIARGPAFGIPDGYCVMSVKDSEAKP